MFRLTFALLLGVLLAPALAQPTQPISPTTADNLTRLATLSGHNLPVNDLDFSDDGALLVSGADDLSVRLWDMTTPDMSQVSLLQGQVHPVRSVDVSPDGRQVLSTGFNGIAFLWDVRSRTRAASVNAENYPSMSDAEYAPDSATFAVALGLGEVWIYDRETQDVTQRLSGDGLLVERLAYAPSGVWLVAGFGFPTDAAIAWDVDTGDRLFTLASNGGTVNGVDVAPDGEALAMGDGSGALALYTLTGALPTDPDLLVRIEDAHPGGVLDVTYSPEGDMIASAGFDGAIRLWDAANGDLLGEVTSDGGRSLNAVAFAPDSTKLAGAGESGDIWLWGVG